MKTIKNIFLILLVLIIISVTALVLSLDYLIVKGVTTFVPPITKTSVELGAVHTSLLNGTASIHDFKLGSPSGFNSTLFSLGAVSVAVDMGTVLKDTIIIKEIKISDVKATVEISSKGTNIGALLKNLESTTGSKNTKAEPAKKETNTAKSSKNVIIKKVVFEKGTLTVMAYGTKIDVPLPDVTLTDIGAKKKRTTVQAFTEIISKYGQAVLTTATTAATNLIKGGTELLNKGLNKAQDTVNESVGKGVDAVNAGLDKAQEGVAKGVDAAQQGINKGIGAVTDTVNSLFSK